MRKREIERVILFAMLEEARYQNAKGLSLREVTQHVRRVRDDLKNATHQGLTVKPFREENSDE